MAGQKTDARDAHVGRRIAEQRRKASLTQKRVAESFGMSAAQLQKYEKGVNRISAIHLETFSRMTGVPLAFFFDGMERGDDVPQREIPSVGFAESAQQGYVTETPLQSLVEVVARHVAEHFPENQRRDFAEAIHALDGKLSPPGTSGG